MIEISIGAVLAAIGAGLAIGLTAIGSGIGVGITGSAGVGAIAENPDKFGTAIVFQALPQTQGIYGLLTAILILMFTGFLGGGNLADVPVSIGLVSIGAGTAVGLAGFSAIGQGIASAAGIGATAEDSDAMGRSMVFSVLPETQAIYGLLVAILLMAFTGMFDRNFIDHAAIGFVAIGCGLAIGLAGLSGIGQGIASAAGVGATAEDSKAMGRSMVFSVLPETQAIYGLLVAILLMAFTGMFYGDLREEVAIGFAAIGCGLAVGLAGLSGIGQGITASSAIGAIIRNPAVMGRGLILSVMSETFAIFGLLVAILIMSGIGLL